jgi:hypothetical protein
MGPTDMVKPYTNNDYFIVSTPVIGVATVCNVTLLQHIYVFYFLKKRTAQDITTKQINHSKITTTRHHNT